MTRGENIDELCRLRSDIVNAGGYVNRTDAQKNRFVQALSEEIQRLQTKPCEDAISRSELLKAIDTWDKFGFEHTGCFVREPKDDFVTYVHYDDVVKCIKGMPSVQPEIIRCHQCKYAEVADSEDSQDGYTCQFHRGSIWFSGSYCSWAERRQNGN